MPAQAKEKGNFPNTPNGREKGINPLENIFAKDATHVSERISIANHYLRIQKPHRVTRQRYTQVA
ncbi:MULTISPECIES: hypothetical protein [unclassified Pseudomonas]|jgi:hypothetical protein|uniref:hypothetical protein n=1 Tax=unclassified Pseudomonas TaxID=196821 RepID=UPI0010329C1B|nr:MULTISPECIES: hypothetical protein [unclassified Pseudomonas]